MNENGVLGNLHPGMKLLLLTAICLCGIVVSVILSAVIAIPFVARDGFDMQDISQNTNLMRAIQLISHVFLFIIPALVFGKLVSKKPMLFFEATNRPRTWQVGLAILLLIVAYPLVAYSAQLNMSLSLPDWLGGLDTWIRETESSTKVMIDQLLGVETYGLLAFNIFLVAIVPAIGEELIFRGIVLRLFKQWTGKAHLAVWLSAIIFSAIHFQFLGFMPRLLLGLLMGYLFVYSRNIWVPIIAHFANNLVAVVAYFMVHNKIINLDFESLETVSVAPTLAAASLLVTVAVFYYYKKRNKF